MRRLPFLASLLLVLQTTSCDNGFLPFSLIQGLRVISIVVDPPELSAGQHATITPTLSPGYEDASIAWAICHKVTFPGQGLINTDCFAETDRPYLEQLGTSPTLAFTMPPDLKVTDLGTPDSSTGFYLPVRWIVTKGNEKLMGFSRVRFYLGMQPPNQNPKLDTIVRVEGGIVNVDGKDRDQGPEILTPVDPTITVAAGSKVRLRATVTPDSLEQYTRVQDLQTLMLQTVNEQARVRWHTTAGKFSQETTGFTVPNPTIPAPTLASITTELDLATYPPTSLPANIDLWVVVTDERGGQGVRHFQLHVQ